MVGEFSFKKKFSQIADEMFIGTTEVGNTASNVPPQTLNVLSMCTRVWVHKIDRMIYSPMHEIFRRQTVISTQAVGHYHCAWPYPKFQILITDSSVSESLDGTGTKKLFPVPRSYPPKTQKPSTQRPLLYFR